MRSMKHKGLVAAMEEQNLIPTDAPAAAAPVVDNAGSAETDMIALTEDMAENAQDDRLIDEAKETVTALESIAESLKAAAENGGINKDAANALNIAVEHMYRSAGVTKQPKLALESFGATQSRIEATQLAIEDLKETAAKVWAAIVAAVKKAIEWAIGFYQKVFNIAEKLEQRAVAMKEQADALQGEMKEKAFEDGRLVKALSIQGKMPSDMNVQLESFMKIVKDVFSNAEEFGGRVAEKTLDAISKTDAHKTFVAEFKLGGASTVNGATKIDNPESEGFDTPHEGLGLFRGKEMFGGKAIVNTMPVAPTEGEVAVEIVANMKCMLIDFNPKQIVSDKTDVPTMTGPDIANLASSCVVIMQAVRGFQSHADKAAEMKKKLLACAEGAGKAADKAVEGETAGLKAMQKVASALPRLIDQPAMAMAAYSMNTCKALLDYAEKSLKQYEAKAEEKAPEAEPAAKAAEKEPEAQAA